MHLWTVLRDYQRINRKLSGFMVQRQLEAGRQERLKNEAALPSGALRMTCE
jgi:hypothetical protein